MPTNIPIRLAHIACEIRASARAYAAAGAPVLAVDALLDVADLLAQRSNSSLSGAEAPMSLRTRR